jgi:multicomponent Na+:H+ antiporter subunit E
LAAESKKEPKHVLGYRLLIFGVLMIIWSVFSGIFDWFHPGLGVISCGFVAWLSGDLIFEDRTIAISSRFGQFFRMLGYIVWLMWQVVLSNLHLLKLAFQGPKSLSPQIIRYETNLKSDFEKFLLANSITLTPGTITMKILGNTYYIHAVSDFTAKGLDGEMERRISAIFNPQTKGGESNG